jgi:hypothetical protein
VLPFNLAKLAELLLANQYLAGVLVQGVQTAFAAKARIDRGLETLLGLLNVPSRADVRRVLTRLDVIQGTLTNLSLKVDRLVADERKRPRSVPASE